MQEKKVRITRRDLLAVRWIAEQGVARIDTVGRLLQQRGCPADERSLRRLAERWDDAGLVTRGRILADAPTLLWPTLEGLRAAGITLRQGQRVDQPSIGTLHHNLAAAEVRLVYEVGGWSWTAERFLDETLRTQHRADGLAERDGTRILVEIERTQKAGPRLLDILRSNLRAPETAGTHYWTTEAVLPVVQAAARQLEPELQPKLHVYLLPEVVR